MTSSVMHVDFLAYSQGNQFMIDIASQLRACFEEVGVTSSLRLDVLPEAEPPRGTTQIIVAPHEYCELFLKRQTVKKQAKSLLNRCWLLNTEQPGSPWFKLTEHWAFQAFAIIDISPLGVEIWKSKGLTAFHAPLPFITSKHPATDHSKDIDILFLGSTSPKRELFLADSAKLFTGHRTHLTLVNPERPRHSNSPGYVSDEALKVLVSRSRILLNVHSDTSRYFEWHRAMLAISQHAVIVSETSDGYSPLIPEENLILADINSLADRCLQLLDGSSRLPQIADNAYRMAVEYFSPDRVGSSLLTALAPEM